MSSSSNSSDSSWLSVNSETDGLQPFTQNTSCPSYCFCFDLCLSKQDENESKVSQRMNQQFEKTIAAIDQVDAYGTINSVDENNPNMKIRHLGPEFGLGRLHFSLMYDGKMQILYVSVIKAAALRSTDTSGKSDPYVIITFSPDCEDIRFKTSKIRETLKPCWNEHFQVYNITNAHLKRMNIVFTVKDWDKFGSHDNIGELNFPLRCLYKKAEKKMKLVDDVDGHSELEITQFQDLIDRVKIAATKQEENPLSKNRKTIGKKKKSTEKSLLMKRVSTTVSTAAGIKKKSNDVHRHSNSVISLPTSHHSELFLSEKVLHEFDNIDSVSDIVPYKEYKMPHINDVSTSHALLEPIPDEEAENIDEKSLSFQPKLSKKSDSADSLPSLNKDEVDHVTANLSSKAATNLTNLHDHPSLLPTNEAAGDTRSEYLGSGTATEPTTPTSFLNNPLETVSALMPRVNASQVDVSDELEDIRTIDVWRNLHPLTNSRKYGQLLLTLCYYPLQCSLVTTVIKARNVLRKNKPILNPFVSLSCVKIEKKREVKLANKKTSMRLAVSNPVWNEHFAFEVYPGELSSIAIDFKVISKNTLGIEHTLGEIRLAKKSLPLASQQWQAMTSKLGIPTAQWHNISK